MLYFADLDENNTVVGVKQVNDDYINPGNSIEIESFDISLLGKVYEDGVFKEVVI